MGKLPPLKYTFHNNSFNIVRYPHTGNRSLRAWSAADEYLIKAIEDFGLEGKNLMIQNDQFGFLGCCLNEYAPITVINNKSQEKAYQLNFANNGLNLSEIDFRNPLSEIDSDSNRKAFDICLLKIPKSLDLFQLYIQQAAKVIKEDGVIFAAFMTRHFSPQLLQIAGLYFEEVTQSKAWKKSRLLTLKKKKKFQPVKLIHEVSLNEKEILQQYFGVFSAKHIDYASQFLIPHLTIKESDQTILDLACGNGVLSYVIRQQHPTADIHLIDDSFLAIESSKFNISDDHTFFHHNDCLDEFEDDFFDLVVCNPPFHFEFSIDINISLELFEEVSRCLKPNGRFLLVANRHLNYKTHLVKIFEVVNILAENEKFVVYGCS